MRHLINEKDDKIYPCKILGILWNEKNDTLCFDFSDVIELSRSLEPSKENVLEILTIVFYDPLGILQLILISLKVLFQNLCKQKFDWDESISDEFKSEWDILSYLGNARTTEIPRKPRDPPQRFELHGFCDASQQSYSVCIYLKSIFKVVSVHLIASKSISHSKISH